MRLPRADTGRQEAQVAGHRTCSLRLFSSPPTVEHEHLVKCALCHIGDALEAGHVIPHFVFRHLIKTSPTGFLRGQQNPNVRVQDGKKRRFLCPACEDRLGSWERLFARTVFHPLHKHQVARDGKYPKMMQFAYGDWLLRFCVAVSWRSLYDLLLDHEHKPLPHGDDDATRRALEMWRRFIIGERDSIQGYEQHMVIVGAPSATRGIENSLDLRQYFERAVTYSTWHSPPESYVFTKMCRVIVAGTIKDLERPWKGTLVVGGSGVFSSREQILSGVLNSWIRSDIAGMSTARIRLSERQHETIGLAVRRFLSNPQADDAW